MNHRVGIAGVVGLVVALGATVLFTWAPWTDDPGPCTIVDAAAMEETVVDGVAWLDRALQPDSRFWYEYDRTADEFSDDYNHVRHAGTLMALYQVAADRGPAAAIALEVGDGGLDFVLDQIVTADDRAAFVEPGRPAALGSSALAVAGLIHRRLATDDPTHDELLRSLGRFMASLQREDGGMWAQATGAELEPTEGMTSTFYTGEAFWAFGLLANTFPDEGWDDHARAVGTYIATIRDVEEEIENPPLADQWAAYGFSEMRTWAELDGAELEYVRLLSETYHDRLRREIGREADRVDDGDQPPDEMAHQARGAAFGTTVEALGSLWRLALVDPGMSDLTDGLADDLVCGASILVARQFDEVRAADSARPDVVEDAWFSWDTEVEGSLTRVDDQQHAVSGVLRAVPAVG